MASKPTLRLVLSDGSESGQEFELSEDQITIGRDPDVDIILSSPSIPPIDCG